LGVHPKTVKFVVLNACEQKDQKAKEERRGRKGEVKGDLNGESDITQTKRPIG